MDSTRRPWQCPQCSTWIAPAVLEHRCGGDGAGFGARLIPVVPVPWQGLEQQHPFVPGHGSSVTMSADTIPMGYVTEPGQAPSLRLLSQHEKPGDPHRAPGIYALETGDVVLTASELSR